MAQIPAHPLKTRITVGENVSNHIRFVNIRAIPIEIKIMPNISIFLWKAVELSFPYLASLYKYLLWI